MFLRSRRVLKLMGWTAWSMIVALPRVLPRGWKGIAGGALMARRWSEGVARIMGLRICVYGDAESVRGALVVSNHLGYMDIIVHGACFAPRFSPKSSTAKWPVVGQMIMLNRPVWIDRGSRQAARKALDEFVDTLRHGLNMLVYPEGTSTDGKGGLIPFKSTAFATLNGNEFPLVPVLTVYRQKEGEPTVCWYGDMTLLPHIWAISNIPETTVEVHILDPVLPQGRDRKTLAKDLHALMDAKYRELSNC